MGKAYSLASDQRLAIEGDVQQVTAPASQMANPLGFAIGSSDLGRTTAEISLGNISITNYPAEVNDLVSTILEKTTQVSEQSTAAVGSVNQTLTDIVEGIKAPLSQYLPYLVIGIVFFVIYVLSKR